MAVASATRFLAIGTTALAVVFLLIFLKGFPFSSPQHAMMKITIAGARVEAEVVSTPQERERGLSGRPSLKEGSGMLFVFQEEGAWGIWMKDMLFPIDILWLDSDGTISTIARNVAPETYPQAFYPVRPARYVLELPAGFAQAHGIEEGQKAQLR